MSEAPQPTDRLFHGFDLRESTEGHAPGIQAEPLGSTEKKVGGIVNRILNALGFGDIYIQLKMPSSSLPLVETAQQYRVNVRSATKYIHAHKDFLVAIGVMREGEKNQVSFPPNRIAQILTEIHEKTALEQERDILKQYGLLRSSPKLRAYVAALGCKMPEGGGSIAISAYMMTLPRKLLQKDIEADDFQHVKQIIEMEFFKRNFQSEKVKAVVADLKLGTIPERGSAPDVIRSFLDLFAKKINELVFALPFAMRNQFSVEKLLQADIPELTALEKVLYFKAHTKELAEDWKDWQTQNPQSSSRKRNNIVNFMTHIRRYTEALKNPLLRR
jgi:hypothetical protein